MREVCKSFQLTNKQVSIYYMESRPRTEKEVHDSYDILPCYSTETMSINGELFSWVIRASGVENFESKEKDIVRVCDEECCNKKKGIC